MKSAMLSSTVLPPPFMRPVEVPSKDQPYTVSAWVKRDGGEWKRVSRTVTRKVAVDILAIGPDPNGDCLTRDVAVARLLLGQGFGPVRLDGIQLVGPKL